MVYTLGIDIGGTKIRTVLFRGRRIMQIFEVATPKNKKEFKKLISELIKKPNANKIKICVGVAGVVQLGRVVSSPNIKYLSNFNFSAIMPKGAIFNLDNDARCFARAECRLGVAKKFTAVFAVILGTGVGRAYAKNKIVKPIKRFEYPEPWEKEYQRVRDGRDLKKFTVFLGQKIFNILALYQPQALVIGGGVLAKNGLIKLLRQELRRLGFFEPVFCSRFKKNSVAIGATLLAF